MNRKEYRSAFGRALDAQLERRGVSQRLLAASVGVSPSYLNKTIKGAKPVSPEFLKVVSSSLALKPDEELVLTYAAVRDAGWDVDPKS